jgi:very-short-patch-repair endonuclease
LISRLKERVFRPGGDSPMTDHDKTHNLPYLTGRRKGLRKDLTPAEAAFWRVLKGKRFEGRKFRRQHSVGNYVLDFYCPEEKLAVELDGEIHFNIVTREYDARRKEYLNQQGIPVLRFENRWVFEELDLVLHIIEENFG